MRCVGDVILWIFILLGITAICFDPMSCVDWNDVPTDPEVDCKYWKDEESE